MITSALEKEEEKLFSSPKNKKGDERNSERDIVLSNRTASIPNSWGTRESASVVATKTKSFGYLLFLVSFIFFIGTILFAYYSFSQKTNAVSDAHIMLEMNVNPFVEGGEKTKYVYSIQNINTLPLLSAYLTVSYEKGVGGDEGQNKSTEKINIGDILYNDVRKGEVELQFFGAENSARDIEVTLHYKVEGSNAVFTKTIHAKTVIKTSPLDVHIVGKESVVSGQEYSATVVIRNNTSTTSEEALLQIAIPNNITIKNATPKQNNSNMTWRIEKLSSQKDKKIEIIFTIKGKAGEKYGIRATVGTGVNDFHDIGNVFSFENKDVNIVHTGLVIKVSSNHENGDVAVNSFLPGERVAGYITYANTSGQEIHNATIALEIQEAQVVNKSVYTEKGYYDSEKNSIVWKSDALDELKSIEINGRGTLGYSFMVPKDIDTASAYTVNVVSTGEFTDGVEKFSGTESKTWKIEGGATLSAVLLHQDDTFLNGGAFPPVANKSTDYTIDLVLSSPNGIRGASYIFTLPPYVSWQNKVYGGATATYNTKNRKVIVTLPDVPPQKTVHTKIQVSFKPSQTQINTSPNITSAISFDGTDAIAGVSLKKVLDAVNIMTGDESTGVVKEK